MSDRDRDHILKRLGFRAWHRGTREADYLIGGFFDRYSPNWGEAELAWFEALLVEVLDHLTSEFEQARTAALQDAAQDPVEALKRLIATMFDPAVSAPDKVAVWYAFWGEAGSRSTYLERVGALSVCVAEVQGKQHQG